MHDSVMRLLQRAKTATANAANPIDGFDALSKDLGVSSATMTNWKKRGLSKEGALDAAKKYRCDPNWLLTGQAVSLQAHNLSHPTPIVDPQTVTWEWILSAKKEELPWRFMVLMPDASLSGKAEKGDELVFEVGYPPRIGKLVLVEQKSTGRRFVRLYAEGAKGWRAIATSSVFLSFENGAEEVDILATVRWSE